MCDKLWKFYLEQQLTDGDASTYQSNDESKDYFIEHGNGHCHVAAQF